MRWERNGFAVTAEADRFSVERDGQLWVTLPIVCQADTEEGLDRDLVPCVFSVRQEASRVECIWTTQSNLWSRKDYVLTLEGDAFLFTLRLQGSGRLRRVRYFSDPSRVRYQVSGYTMPLANHRNEAGNSRLVTEDGQLEMWYAAPPMYVFAFSMEGEPGSLGLGLAAKPGQYNFDVFRYRTPMQFELPLYGETSVEDSWEAPGIWGGFGADTAQVLRAYTQWHFTSGYATPHRGEIPDWWRRPIFCGWGEQTHYQLAQGLASQHDAATQENYESMLAKLRREGLDPGTVIIDSKWQSCFGTLTPEPVRWPDLRAFADGQHLQGRHVLLWVKSWDCEGLPAEECVQLLCNPVAADPTNPRYIARLRAAVTRLLSDAPGCMNCDGFKVDFINCIPPCQGTETCGGIRGVELIRAWMQLLYDAAKAAKADALIDASCCHPYLTQFVDMPRLHDYLNEARSCVSVMGWRHTLFTAANPGVPVDQDAGGVGSRRDFHRYLQFQATHGVPCLYCLSPAGEVPFDDEDFRRIRDCWSTYTEALDSGKISCNTAASAVK